VLLALILPTSICAGCVLWARSERIYVTIDNLGLESRVSGKNLRIEGVVYPQDAEVFVLVRPMTSEHWWVQQQATRAPSGAWWCEANFGTAKEGTLDDYLVVAVATRMPVFFRSLSQTMLKQNSSVKQLPPMPCSDVYVVRGR